MREITDHKFNGLNEAIEILADEPDPNCGNASHTYAIRLWTEDKTAVWQGPEIKFQRGPIKEVGVNGLSNEALLAIVIDRLRGFQLGEFACHENAMALTMAEESLAWLKIRTQQRIERGVEGTNVK